MLHEFILIPTIVSEKWSFTTIMVHVQQLSYTQVEEKTDTDMNMSTIFEIIKREKRVRLECLVFNRRSFAQTVENLFALSFLIKDGRAEIIVDATGSHLVCKCNLVPWIHIFCFTCILYDQYNCLSALLSFCSTKECCFCQRCYVKGGYLQPFCLQIWFQGLEGIPCGFWVINFICRIFYGFYSRLWHETCNTNGLMVKIYQEIDMHETCYWRLRNRQVGSMSNISKY